LTPALDATARLVAVEIPTSAEPQPGAVPVYRFVQRRTAWSYSSADVRAGARSD